MSKKNRRKKQATPPPGRSSWLWMVGALAIILLGSGLSALLIFGSSAPATGTPRLVVDQPVVDEGYLTLNTPVRTAFTLRNEGNGPLRVLGEPQVQLVEGC